MPYIPKLAVFLVHLLRIGLAECKIGIKHSAISAFFGTTSSYHIEINVYFLFTASSFTLIFVSWDAECLLSLLENWAPASSLTTFKLVWKTATLLVLVTAR